MSDTSQLTPAELNLLGHLKLRNKAMAIRARCRHQIVVNGRPLSEEQQAKIRQWATLMAERANVGIRGIKVATGRFTISELDEDDTP